MSLVVQQLANMTNRRFSFFVIPFSTTNSTTGFLGFGQDIDTPGRNLHWYKYYDGQRIGFPPETFLLKRDGTGGCIIDSGTPATLPQEILHIKLWWELLRIILLVSGLVGINAYISI